MRTQPQEIIRQLEEKSGRLDKESILERAINEGCDEFFHGVQMALDKLCTFGVKQVPFKEGDGQGLDWRSFRELAGKLQKRELTGHAARDAIQLAMDVATEEQWNGYYRRILIKDLRCGVSEKTVNKVCKKLKRDDLMVPVFSCQLAHDGAKYPKKIKGWKLIEGKLDGSRLLIVVNKNGAVECFSRNGKQVTNFKKVEQQFSDAAETIFESRASVQAVVFDGEIMSSSFQDLMKQMHRKTDVQTDDAVYHVFDMIELGEFTSGKCELDQKTRSEELQGVIGTIQETYGGLENVNVVGWEMVNLDTANGKKRFEEINRDAIESGLEGIMIKDPDAPYECKRSHSWLKIKPVISVDLEIVDCEEGTGRNEGRLGAFVAHGFDDGREIHVNVGSGFSDDQRIEFWETRDECIGMIIEVRADDVTQNADGTYSLRFPRFERFRGFEPHEKI